MHVNSLLKQQFIFAGHVHAYNHCYWYVIPILTVQNDGKMNYYLPNAYQFHICSHLPFDRFREVTMEHHFHHSILRGDSVIFSLNIELNGRATDMISDISDWCVHQVCTNGYLVAKPEVTTLQHYGGFTAKVVKFDRIYAGFQMTNLLWCMFWCRRDAVLWVSIQKTDEQLPAVH